VGTVARVVVTGMHSGPSPSPGLGVARSLRAHDPGLRLIGLDYSPTSSGLHHDLLDEVVVMPSWDQLEPDVWAERVRALVDEPATRLISTLDLEARLLAQRLAPHPRLLSPPRSTFDLLGKPPLLVADMLGLQTSRHLPRTDPVAVEAFLRTCSNGAWVKGQHYEAFHVHSAREAFAVGDFVEQVWGSEWHLEEHLHGQECGIAFCAVDGTLVDAVHMAKMSLTPDGKTWSGRVRPLQEPLRTALARFLDRAGWHGGGEIEMITRWDDRSVALEVNPRFPAWIHGATLCGINLPAALLTGAPVRTPCSTEGFTRTVEEIPIRDALGQAEYPWGTAAAIRPSVKHPTDMRSLGRRCSSAEDPATGATRDGGTRTSVPVRPFPHAVDVPDPDVSTPYVQLRPELLDEQLTALRQAFADRRDVVLAYSVKTAPDRQLMKRAARSGLVAEVISTDEYDAAVEAGFAPHEIVLNGPAKLWPPRPRIVCDALFADSMEELEQVHRQLDQGLDLEASVVGIRLAPVSGTSRFGVRLRTRDDVTLAARSLADLQTVLGCSWGVHFHQAQSAIGTANWEAAATAALLVVDALAEVLGEPPGTVDLGGGWHPDDLDAWPDAVTRVLSRGPDRLRDGTARLILEPGKLLTRTTRSLVSRVLVTRPGTAGRAAVVDASIADLPDARFRPHPVARWDRRAGRWEGLRPGRDELLGRSCMEDDVLAHAIDLGPLAEGDHVVFATAGAYDLSMAYPFGRGVTWATS
jgi:diaminopimelate decarboxylase